MLFLRNQQTSALVLAIACCFLSLWVQEAQAASKPPTDEKPLRTFSVSGVVQKVDQEQRSIVIAHEAITNYMKAMTMPFKVKKTADLEGLQRGDRISFLLHVSDTESWVDQISKTGKAMPLTSAAVGVLPPVLSQPKPHHPLMDYHFTNELGQAVSLGEFRGQALGITFFFTRCPIPDFCPRLSKNFAEASRKLNTLPNAPTNWHFLSVTFDPEFDTSPILKAYADRYEYDSKHWSFLTGPLDKIRELAGQSDVSVQRDAGLFNHNFRTLIIDAAGHLQMVFPTSGDLSDAIVSEIVKAAAVPNPSS